MKDILNVKNTKKSILSNIQPNISINKKKHLSNIHSDKIHTKKHKQICAEASKKS